MTQARVIRFFILGLPVGLILGGTIAMFLYFRDGAEASTLQSRKPVSRRDLQSHVEVFANKIGPRHAGQPERLRAAVTYIESTLGPANLGYKVARQTYKADGIDCHNLELEIPGTHPQHKDEIVLTGAHYDSVAGTPGADGNASGVAACISLAQAFAKTEHERTLRFVFFARGEPPHVQTDAMGSLVYARACKNRGEKIVAMLSLESMGYYSTEAGSQKTPPGLETAVPDKGNFLAVAGNATSAPLVEHIRSWFERNSTLPVTGLALPVTSAEHAGANHWSFWQEGYPAVAVTDTGALRNPHYHTAQDTADTLDYDRLTQAVKGLEAVITELANPGRSGALQ